MDFDSLLLDEILQTVEDMPEGQIFFAKSLLKESEWIELPKGDRLNFGRYFKAKVESGRIPNVRYIGKAANNSAQYQKEKEK